MIVGSFCAQTDPALFSGADAAMAVEELATSIRQLTAKQAQFAARVDECHSHSRRFASSDDFLARVNGSSRGDAKRAIDTARRLRLTSHQIMAQIGRSVPVDERWSGEIIGETSGSLEISQEDRGQLAGPTVRGDSGAVRCSPDISGVSLAVERVFV